jgi:uncharacterized protein
MRCGLRAARGGGSERKMSVGLISLLDDVIGLAKIAAASLDDAAAQATKAGVKVAGVVIDDAAVTPRYVVGLAARRELAIVGKIAMGSIRNKLLFLLPAALLLNWLAPWLITPVLMIGGAFLCYEGAEKIYESLAPHAAHHHEEVVAAVAQTPEELENQKVNGAIRTDFILSAEIMAITLATVALQSLPMQVFVLVVVALVVTIGVYGAVALIVKADDVGVSLAGNARPAASLLGMREPDAATGPGALDRFLRPLTQAFGRGLVTGMPHFLTLLAVVGTLAMLWVGGGILLHGLETYGLHAVADTLHAAEDVVHRLLPVAGAFGDWLVLAIASAICGLLVGGILIPIVGYAAPVIMRLAGRGAKPG